MKPIKSGRDESKRVVTDPYHTSYSVNPETALRSLTGQHKHDDLVVYPIDPGREEAHVKYSPTASSRREVSAQPSMNKRPNANDTSTTLRPGHTRAHSSNHGRTESSPGKTAEGPLPAISYSPSSRPTEEKHGHVAQASLERHVNELDPGASRDFGTTRDRGDRPQLTEREPMAVASPGVVLSSTTPVVMPQMVAHDGRPVIAHGLVAGNSHDSKNSDYQQSIQRAQHRVLDTAPREQDVIRKQRREGTKNSRSPNKDQVQLIHKEEHDHHRPPLDNRNTSRHEGLAHLGKKTGTGTSPVITVPQNSFPQPDPQSTFSEIDSRYGTPRNVLQSSPGQHPASSIVKTPNQGVNKPEINQEYSPKASISRPHDSPSRYPHSVYRPSSSSAVNNATQQSTMDYSKNHPSPPIPSNHSQSHSPTFLPSRDARETTPVVIHNEQPLPDSTENGNRTSSKYHRGQPKEQASASPRSARPDSSRMAPSKPFNPLANPQLPEPINYQTTSSHAVQPVMNRRIAETNPVPLPPSSLLFSKGIDQSSSYTPPEYQGTGDSRSMLNNHLPRATEYSHGPSPNDQDFEKHEPRLITPKSQKLPEFSELQQKSTHYDGAKVNALEPYQDSPT
ncbi:hypothetical protein M378DRAFT_695067 [Amanita muscaria Koide BX008]|uniref:Uncharacterized protein n=1 Tax=Amanita muscaria (strain Koide BX008) TaxID=946122 RepID=A0A0C2T1J7_AMAMK|nr:hypothetical protein M378DRAFT_695067 [Amanita muscaria Koide BX008]